MKSRLWLSVLLICVGAVSTAFAGQETVLQMRNSNAQVQMVEQRAADNEAPLQIDEMQLANASENPDFLQKSEKPVKTSIKTVKTLVPYEDLYKVLQQDIGKYFILPIEEFEKLKLAKEAWLASSTKPVADPPPLTYQINSASIDGRIEENFARLNVTFKIETFTEAWHEIPLLWGSLAVSSVRLNDSLTTLKTSWIDKNKRQVQFGKISRQSNLMNISPAVMGGNDNLSQNNWKDTMFSLPVFGKGLHECQISFLVPVQNIDDLFTLQFSMTRIPLTFMELQADNFILSIDSSSFRDYSVISQNQAKGCKFIGWLGANSDISIKWRRRVLHVAAPEPVAEPDDSAAAQPDEENLTTVTQERILEPVTPIVYARSNTLVTLGDTAIHSYKTFDFKISKAPVTHFYFNVPKGVEIVSVNADRQITQRMLLEGGQKKLQVEFQTGREDNCQIEIAYESAVNMTSSIIGIPEVAPLQVERELGTIAVEALTSIEVQPGNDDKNPLHKGVFPIDPLETPASIKARATMPLLLAYRHNTSPTGIMLAVKRYLDVPQQSVVADNLEVKTTFTTNKTSNWLINLNIRNNNKQYLQLQLASGTEITSAFRGGQAVKLVAGKSDGKVQIPLEMSQVVGETVEQNLQILFKTPVDEIKWRGGLEFTPPLVDIPVSRFSWYIYAPESYHLYNFDGTVKEAKPRQDPFFFRGFMYVLKTVWKLVTSPDMLFTLGFFVILIMLIIARNLLLTILKGIWDFICSIFTMLFSGKGFRLAELMIVVAIIGVLAAIATPNFRKAREQARDKACMANMRVLAGAVEMYNMDNPGLMQQLDMNALLKGKYLKSPIVPAETGCRYLSIGDLSADGEIYCQLHGNIDRRSPEELRGDMRYASVSRRDEDFQARNEISMEQKAMPTGKMAVAPSTQAQSPGFGTTRTRGMLPISGKFVMTKNYYMLERDLVISDIASNGALIANSTSPTVRVNYLHTSVVRSAEIIAFVMALFSSLYFVSGAFLRYHSKITFAFLIIVLLSIIDFKIGTLGDSANTGLWLGLIGAVIWKFFWILSKLNIFKNSEPDQFPPKPPRPVRTNDDDLNAGDVFGAGSNSGRANVKTLFLLIVILTCLASLPAFAQETREVRIMAPFKELSSIMPANERVVIIPESDYRYLTDIKEIEKPEPLAPQSYRFVSVAYRGNIEERGARFVAEYKLDLFNPEWKKIELLSPDVIPSKASLNGASLALTLMENYGRVAYGFMTNATGSINVNVEFFVPMDSSEYRQNRRFTLPTLPVCMSTLQLSINEKDCEAWIDPGVLGTAERSENKSVFNAILPPTNAVNVEIYRTMGKVPEVEPAQPEEVEPDKPVVIEEKTRLTVNHTGLLYFREGFVSGTSIFDVDIKGGTGIASLSFVLPERIRIQKIDNRLIDDWKIREEDQLRWLDVVFKSQIRGKTQLVIEYEEDIQNLKDENYVVGEIYIAEAERTSGIIGIGCLQTLELLVQQTPQGFDTINAAEFLNNWRLERPEKTPYAFRFVRYPAGQAESGAPPASNTSTLPDHVMARMGNNLTITITRPEDISQQTATIDRAEAMTLLNEDGYMITRVVYEVRNNSQQFLKVRLPKLEGYETELWSTQVAGLAVRAGFDKDHGVYNLPIISSQSERGESRAFPVELVYTIKLGQQLQAFNPIKMELPAAHLPISELSWVLYLPEGYELMREVGNLDRSVKVSELKFLDKPGYFSSVSSAVNLQMRKKSSTQQIQLQNQRASDKIYGLAGMLPVKFKIPTTQWSIHFTMLQIEPDSRPPFIDGMLVNPRKGKGFAFQVIMILAGILAAIGLIKLFTSTRRYVWFMILAVLGIMLTISIYLKLYQADHFFQMGISTAMTSWLLFRFFAWRPADEEKGA
ncbi:MAG: prepilin-type N-terminal cleavage/methylation domain-containing protein [Candidatus Riflebacteria bacterium]|nr:prepilin-type N-terminal cleavage/methylation domain-containing protein [Candidatus Riflebacteria bacterium]